LIVRQAEAKAEEAEKVAAEQRRQRREQDRAEPAEESPAEESTEELTAELTEAGGRLTEAGVEGKNGEPAAPLLTEEEPPAAAAEPNFPPAGQGSDPTPVADDVLPTDSSGDGNHRENT
jgi:N utilization substance protein A